MVGYLSNIFSKKKIFDENGVEKNSMVAIIISDRG
jgi:hypothetical protein